MIAALGATAVLQRGAPELVGVRLLRGAAISMVVLGPRREPLELAVERVVGGRLKPVRSSVISQQPRVTLVGRIPSGGRLQTVADRRLRPLGTGVGTRTIRLRAPPGVYVLTIYARSRRGSSAVVRLARGGRLSYVLEPYTEPGTQTRGAGAIAQTEASVSGTVDPYGQATDYYFQYGATSAYGVQTATGSTSAPRAVVASLVGLSFASAYHYRLVATNCGGCRWGTSHGADRTFTTLAANGLSEQQVDADRAVSTYNAIQQYFYASDGSGLYAGAYPPSGKTYSFLWPFSRALVGTMTLAGVPSALLGAANYQADVADRLTGLSRYWDTTGPDGAGYASYPPAPYGTGGDKYYDDDAWVGLASAEYYAMSGDTTALADAQNAFNFVYPGGWAASAPFDPGGIYWVNQGVGLGMNNHDRTTTSNAPNAELALLLGNTSYGNEIYNWLNQYLYNVPGNPNYDSTQPALMFDHVTYTGIVKTLYTYNQGVMIALNARLYQQTGQATYLQEAEAIANTALNTFSESYYVDHSAPFNAIFFRGLLVLASVANDPALQARITQTIQTYADDAWANYRSSDSLFRFPSTSGTGDQLLDQGALLQIYSMLAWNPGDYGKLP